MPTWKTGAAAFESARMGGSFLLALVGNAVLLPVVLFICWDWPQLMERAGCLVPPGARIASGAS